MNQTALIHDDIETYLKAQEHKSLLRFITCGSVDDGKSTLIGRLLWDSKLIYEDQLAALEADSKRVGTQGEEIDYALLLDGLQAEREQGITIDVAYRFFSTDKRKFIVADTPGHEQYTRNMVTGASTAQVAVILVDARKGILTQTKRHSYLVSLVGIRHVVLAVNKMDLVDYRQDVFEKIRSDYELFAGNLGFENIVAIPMSALKGDNVIEARGNTDWYTGPSLMQYLETVRVEDAALRRPFRFPVQWVNRPNLDFRGFSGTIASGEIRVGDEIVVASSGQKSRIARIVTMDGDLEQAEAGMAVTLCLEDEIDISRGDLLVPADQPAHLSDRLEAKLVWLHEKPLRLGAEYLLKSGCNVLPARVTELPFRVNVNSLDREDGGGLRLNEVGVGRISLSAPLAFDSYRENRATGSFILVDRLTNATVGAGMIHQPLRSGAADSLQPPNAEDRARLLGQPPLLLLIPQRGEKDGQLAGQVEALLLQQGRHTARLDAGRLLTGLPDFREEEQKRLLAAAAEPMLAAGLWLVLTLPEKLASDLASSDALRQSGSTVLIDDDRLQLHHNNQTIIGQLTTTATAERAAEIVNTLRSQLAMV
ncbi:MAG: sulfate adenylyltransferase subunit CysN [Geothermobacteraceae bacterium]